MCVHAQCPAREHSAAVVRHGLAVICMWQAGVHAQRSCLLTAAGVQVATGTYSNCFRLLTTDGGSSGGDLLLEASRDPQRKRLQSAKVRTGFAGAPAQLQVPLRCVLSSNDPAPHRPRPTAACPSARALFTLGQARGAPTPGVRAAHARHIDKI